MRLLSTMVFPSQSEAVVVSIRQILLETEIARRGSETLVF